MQPDFPNKPNIFFFLFLTLLGENGRRSLSMRPGLHFSPQPVENVLAPMHLPTFKTTLKLGRSEADLWTCSSHFGCNCHRGVRPDDFGHDSPFLSTTTVEMDRGRCST